MEQLIAQIVTIAKGMWRFRWPALAVAWLVAVVGMVIVFKVPDKFEASARIFVDTQSILKPLMSGLAVQPRRHGAFGGFVDVMPFTFEATALPPFAKGQSLSVAGHHLQYRR